VAKPQKEPALFLCTCQQESMKAHARNERKQQFRAAAQAPIVVPPQTVDATPLWSLDPITLFQKDPSLQGVFSISRILRYCLTEIVGAGTANGIDLDEDARREKEEFVDVSHVAANRGE
jgi:hypothetical protein